MDHTRTGIRVRIFLQCGAQAHRLKHCYENSGCQSRGRQRMRQVEKSTCLGLQESQTHVRSSSTRQEGLKICSYRILHGPLPSQTLRACEISLHVQGESRAPGASKTTVETAEYSASENGKIPGYNFQTAWNGWRRRRRSFRLRAGAHVGSAKIIAIARERVLTSVDKTTTQSMTEAVGFGRRTSGSP